MFIGPHSHAGQNTSVSNDFMKPGGTFINSRVIWPLVTASRCSHTACKGQPSTNRVWGSKKCQQPSWAGVAASGQPCQGLAHHPLCAHERTSTHCHWFELGMPGHPPHVACMPINHNTIGPPPREVTFAPRPVQEVTSQRISRCDGYPTVAHTSP